MTSHRTIPRSLLLSVLVALAALCLAGWANLAQPASSTTASSTNASSTDASSTTASSTAEGSAGAAEQATDSDRSPDVSAATDPATSLVEPADAAGPSSLRAEIDTIDWSTCGRLECGAVEVPIDYDDPESDTITIAVNKRRADSHEDRIGYLLANPGGPGNGGLSLVEEAEGLWSPAILERFDIVGFDPRGTGESEPTLSCGTDEEAEAIAGDFTGEYGSSAYIELGEQLLELCFENSGPALGRVHAQYVARDMDEIRQALGAEQISFHGLSWGAHIGVWYATLFPDHTRAMVIDAALDPTQIGHTRIQMQIGYDIMLRQALEACDASCPIYNDGDPVGYYLEAIQKYALVAEAMGEDGNVGNALLDPVYEAGSFPTLWNAIYELGENDNPAPFVEIGSQAETDDPSAEELALVEKHTWTSMSANCVDELVLHPEVTRDYLLNERTDIDRPLLEAAFSAVNEAHAAEAEQTGLSLNFCAFLHPYAPEPFAGTFDGGDVPIVVVANAFEGPVPYGQSKTMAADVLADGYLVDVLGSGGHVVYPSNRCVVEVVDAHLLTTKVPADRTTTCADESDRESGDDLAAQVQGQCIERVMAELGDDVGEPAEVAGPRAEFVCEDLVNRVIAEEGRSGLANTDLLDRYFVLAVDQASSIESMEELTVGFCLRLLGEQVGPDDDPIPAAKAESLCDTILERAVAEGGEDALDDDVLLDRIFGEVIEEEFGTS